MPRRQPEAAEESGSSMGSAVPCPPAADAMLRLMFGLALLHATRAQLEFPTLDCIPKYGASFVGGEPCNEIIPAINR